MSLLAEVTRASCSSCAICSAVFAGDAAFAAAVVEFAFFDRVEGADRLEAGILADYVGLENEPSRERHMQ